MTPSEAHDSAWMREPGHDAMQLAVMRHIAREWRGDTMRVETGSGYVPCRFQSVHAERMFRDGRRTFFADLAIEYGGEWIPDRTDGPRGFSVRVLDLLEIKPRIHSAGAVLRQVAVLRDAAEAWLADGGRAPHGVRRARCFAVVDASDPAAQTLADLGQCMVYTWNGSGLGLLEPAPLLTSGEEVSA